MARQLYLTFLVAAVAIFQVDADAPVEITRHWAGGFNGKFCVNISKELTSWKAHLKFDQPIDSVEVWLATAEKVGKGQEYILTNKAWNGNEHVGDKLCLEFMGHTKEDIMPSAVVYIQELEPTGASIVHTFPPHTTPAVPHTGGGKPTFDYTEALKNSILFYNAQRSGKLPADNPIKWRGDSALKDGSDVGLDLTGGWYDAGDHVKFGLPMAATSTVLLWGYHQWADAYAKAGLADKFLDMIKWPLDYFLKCWRPKEKEFYVQIGDGTEDHHFWGRAEDMTMKRPAYKVTTTSPGSDIAGETAAAMAAGSMAFKSKDPGYAQKLLTASKSLYEFAKTYKGVYSQSVTAAAAFYSSSTYKDELCLGAVWLYKATKDKKYLTEALSYHENAWAWALSWDDKKIACQIMLYELTLKSNIKEEVEGFFKGWSPQGTIKYTPCGFAWRDQWGSTRYTANTAFISLVAADIGINTLEYRKWSISQIDYILGQNNKCFSYAIGFGKKYPVSPHHRSASCPDIPQPCSEDNLHAKGPSPHLLVGALVGGPDATDAYTDNREDYVHNEVACDYNSGFQSALVGLLHLANTNNYPVPDKPKCPCKNVYIVFTSKHGEGFTNWPSNISFNWNSLDVGPRIDIVGELHDAIRGKTKLHFGLYHCLYEWLHPLYLDDKENIWQTRNFVKTEALPGLYEIVNKYKPDIVWSDGDYEAPDTYWHGCIMTVKDVVVTNDRWGIGANCSHGGVWTCRDRYLPGKLQTHKWVNAMTIDRQSWGFRRNIGLSQYLSIQEILVTFVQTVSCGGNMLMNVGPQKDGIIAPIFEERLRQLGKWLGVKGEAIRGTHPWTTQNDTVVPTVWYTKKADVVYAILLNWPEDTLSLAAPIPSSSTTVTLLGTAQQFQWKSRPSGIDITIPQISFNKMPCEWAWVLKFTDLQIL